MLPPSLVFVIAICLSVFNLDHVESRKLSWDVLPSPTVCLNCTTCQSPCHQTAPPPPPPQLPEQPIDGVPPPPPPPQLPEQPIYGVPPPPPPPVPVSENPYPQPPPGGNCSQVPPECCHPPPYPLGYQPPSPFGYQPPPFGYQPVVENYSRCFSPGYFVSVVSFLFSIVLLL